jgi:hypothetical protein
MIQFNFLPDVKIQYIRTKRLKRLVTAIASLAAIAALVIAVSLFVAVGVFQKKHLNDINKDIQASINHIKQVPDINRILTVQNQLNNLGPLHDQKPVTTRMFAYLSQITPAEVNISKLSIDYVQHTLIFDGTADKLESVNRFVDTLKFTTYTVGDETDSKKAFADVVLTSFGRTDKEATYTVNLNFDPAIFDSTQAVKLVVPNTITTRSALDKPQALFQTPTTTKSEGQ